ncbi:MAG: hypothetical protein K0B11_16490 [Mariniphaga sp.]|nr:hypothetical protein [Mariniphaga sp.]
MEEIKKHRETARQLGKQIAQLRRQLAKTKSPGRKKTLQAQIEELFSTRKKLLLFIRTGTGNYQIPQPLEVENKEPQTTLVPAQAPAKPAQPISQSYCLNAIPEPVQKKAKQALSFWQKIVGFFRFIFQTLKKYFYG